MNHNSGIEVTQSYVKWPCYEDGAIWLIRQKGDRNLHHNYMIKR